MILPTNDTEPPMPEQSHQLTGWLLLIARVTLTLIFPALLILTSVRVVMTETFLRFEYNRPGFPSDRYGFTTEDRLTYGPYGVQYIVANKDISYLADLEIDGAPLFRQKELDHMADVQVVTRVALRLQLILLALYLVIATALAARHETRWALRQSLVAGGIFTIAGLLTLLVLVFASWDFFFDGFHGIFFEGDSWLFRTSDALIRLYPEQFWFDAALTIGLLTIGGALAAIGGVWWWERRQLPVNAPPTDK